MQAQVESYLRLRRIPYIRIPDAVYRSISSMSKGAGIGSARSLRGVPDLTLFKVTPEGFTMCLPFGAQDQNGQTE